MNASWLAVSLSARGLLRELEWLADDDGEIEIPIADASAARAIGDELARLLCAFRHEYARVRRDVAALLDHGLLSVEGSRLCLLAFEADDVVVSTPLSTGGSARRMRELRARRRAEKTTALASLVTAGDVTRDASSDGGDDGDASLPHSLNETKLVMKREERRHRDAGSDGPERHRSLTRDTPFDDRARAIAEKVGVRNASLAWLGFAAHHAGKSLDRDWEDLWQKWAAREANWQSEKPETRKQDVDLDAPWFRTASGRSP